MVDWGDDGEGVAIKLSSNWDDEHDIPEAWDAEKPESEAQPRPKPVAKVTLIERIMLKEENKRKERDERQQQEELLRSSQSLSELQREQLAEKAELGILGDTFGAVTAASDGVDESIDRLEPSTLDDFNRLNCLIKDRILKFKASPHFSTFFEQLVKDIAPEVDTERLRVISTTINLIIEKQKSSKVKGKKKQKGRSLVVERTTDYDYIHGDNEEYEDFI